eukprot:TRINITY_DN1941_c1_g1_i1.p1 TRINITY_DN1941_c1_g1~~TRINITY_DN1941_c1_g1_i1.p1  ORF type:complete len:377 (+),score=50.31 TRINITY_DN1941_c1_g1_i1:45-1175(+)
MNLAGMKTLGKAAGMPTGNVQRARQTTDLRKHAAASGVLPVDLTNHCSRGTRAARMTFSRCDSFFSSPAPDERGKPADDRPSPRREAERRERWVTVGRVSSTFSPPPAAPPGPEKPLEPGRWVVTNPKGLLVRGSVHLASAEKGTVACGQVMRIVEIAGRRGRVSGMGGVTAGWVSLVAAGGRELAERCPDDGSAPLLPRRSIAQKPASPRSDGAGSLGPGQAKAGSILDSEGYFGGLSPLPSPRSPQRGQTGGAPPVHADPAVGVQEDAEPAAAAEEPAGGAQDVAEPAPVQEEQNVAEAAPGADGALEAAGELTDGLTSQNVAEAAPGAEGALEAAEELTDGLTSQNAAEPAVPEAAADAAEGVQDAPEYQDEY